MCVFHENGDAVRLADLVYSPRACFVGASRVLCCVVDVYGMQHLSWLSFTVEMSFWIITRRGTLCRAKTIFCRYSRSGEAKNELPCATVSQCALSVLARGFRNCWHVAVALNICRYVGPYLSTFVIRSRLVDLCKSVWFVFSRWVARQLLQQSVISILCHCSGSQLIRQ